MEPTLQGTGASSLIGQDRRAEKTPGTITLDHVLVDCLSYRFTELKRGDFLAFKTGNIDAMARRHPPGAQDQVWVELLISLPGEFVEFKDGTVFADGVRLAEGGELRQSTIPKSPGFDSHKER
jgi:hypothetical protein